MADQLKVPSSKSDVKVVDLAGAEVLMLCVAHLEQAACE